MPRFKQILVVQKGLICVIQPADGTEPLRICYIPSTWGARASGLIWVPDIPSESRLVAAWSKQNQVYLWVKDPKLSSSPLKFYSLDLDQMASAWRELASTPADLENIRNVALQHDGLRDALFVLAEVAGHAQNVEI